MEELEWEKGANFGYVFTIYDIGLIESMKGLPGRETHLRIACLDNVEFLFYLSYSSIF